MTTELFRMRVTRNGNSLTADGWHKSDWWKYMTVEIPVQVDEDIFVNEFITGALKAFWQKYKMDFEK